LSALEKAHALGIAHRDIKPANIFLVPTAFGDKVQVLDFGLAKMVTTGGAEVTRSGALVGTPRYMAPEQVRGEQVSEVADIYSMGLVLAEMLSGTPVVSATKEIDIYMAHGSDEPLDLPEVVVRSPVAPIIRRAVAKRLEVRYRQAAQMLVDLRAVLKMMVAGEGHVVAPDLDATFITDPSRVRPRSLPTERSEKLRDAFNRMADKQRIEIPDAAPTLVRPVPEGPRSAPILLTRNADEEIDTLRIAPAPSPPPIELTAADDAGADALAPAAPRNRAATTAVLLVLAFLVAAVIAVYLSAS
jgi:serine/threonine protein kinase